MFHNARGTAEVISTAKELKRIFNEGGKSKYFLLQVKDNKVSYNSFNKSSEVNDLKLFNSYDSFGKDSGTIIIKRSCFNNTLKHLKDESMVYLKEYASRNHYVPQEPTGCAMQIFVSGDNHGCMNTEMVATRRIPHDQIV